MLGPCLLFRFYGAIPVCFSESLYFRLLLYCIVSIGSWFWSRCLGVHLQLDCERRGAKSCLNYIHICTQITSELTLYLFA